MSAPPVVDLACYAAEPVPFVRDVLHGRPWRKQVEILEAVRDHPRVTVRACHGVGKSWVAASAVAWFLHTHNPAVVLTTAPSRRQVKQILWREIRSQHRKNHLLDRYDGAVLSEVGVELSEDRFALGLATNEPERFQGFHGENILIVVDEASGVNEEIFEAIEGAMTSGHARLLLIGNPTRIAGTFYDSHHTDDSWRRIHISAFDSPAFTGDWQSQGLTAKDVQRLVTPEWVESRAQGWGEDSAKYEVRVLGQFPTKGTDNLVPLGWIDRAVRAWRPVPGMVDGSWEMADGGKPGMVDGSWEMVDAGGRSVPHQPSTINHPPSPITHQPCEFGVDVARFGDCESVVFVRRGDVVTRMEAWNGADLMDTTGRVARMIAEEEPQAVKIDACGIGGAVVDRLKELGHKCVVAVNVAEAARDREQYALLRDEIAFGLRERFREERIQLLPVNGRPEPKLSSQLAGLKYKFSSSGQYKVESKDEMRRRGLPSPDRADALILCFAAIRSRLALPVASARKRT